MSASHASGAHYYYSVAELGYLQRFVEAHPDRLDSLRAVGADLRIVGGGITSPDSLLPPGEAFIRDYLVGKTWVDATLGLAIRQAWVPDDFGHDAQLPIVLEAMGFEGVGFGRVPGVGRATQSLGFTRPDPGSPPRPPGPASTRPARSSRPCTSARRTPCWRPRPSARSPMAPSDVTPTRGGLGCRPARPRSTPGGRRSCPGTITTSSRARRSTRCTRASSSRGSPRRSPRPRPSGGGRSTSSSPPSARARGTRPAPSPPSTR